MSKEIPNFRLAPGQRRAPQDVSIGPALVSFQAHFETGVQPESHLSQTSSITYNLFFWVFVSECLISSHRPGPKASNFAKFAAPGKQKKAESLPVSFLRPSWKAGDRPLLWFITRQRPDPKLDDERRRYYKLAPLGRGVLEAATRYLSSWVDLKTSVRVNPTPPIPS
jgi:hypothetical protein